MLAMKFREVLRSSFLQERPKSFSMVSNGYFQALISSTNEVTVFELLVGPKFSKNLLFTPTFIPVSKERFTTDLLGSNPVFSDMYGKCTVEQSQELVLDPIFVGAYCTEPLLPGNVEVAFAPMEPGDELCVIGVLTSFGNLDIFTKRQADRSWEKRMPSFNKHYDSVFPRKGRYKPTDNFEEFRTYVNTYWVTAFTWHNEKSNRIMFTANARGDIVVFQLTRNYMLATMLCKTETPLGRITFMHCFGDGLLLVANVFGVVHLYRLAEEQKGDWQLLQTDVLSSKPDRMTLGKACHIDAPGRTGYVLLYPKAAHMILHYVSQEGKVLDKFHEYCGGMKIADIAVWPQNSFMVVNMIGAIRRVHVNFKLSGKMSVKVQAVLADSEVASNMGSYEVVGAAGSANSNLWFVMYSRVRDADPKKVKPDHCLLVMYRIDGFNVLDRLVELQYSHLDPYIDYAFELKMNIMHNAVDLDYHLYLEQDYILPEIDDLEQLHRLRMRYMATGMLLSTQQHDKLKQCDKRHQFFGAYLNIAHIITTQRYFKKLLSKFVALSGFQRTTSACMSTEFFAILEQLRALETHDFSLAIEPFVRAVLNIWMSGDFPRAKWNEKCKICDRPTDSATRMCPLNHKLNRCSISYQQLSMFDEVSCAHCDARFHGKQEDLKSLFETDQKLACIQCSFAIPFTTNVQMIPTGTIGAKDKK